MRPVDKGTTPTTYTNYSDAIKALVSRLGDYCSYCERQIETYLSVEHVQPKSLVPALRNSWGNFLLACVNCNSCKGNTAIHLSNYLWPDCDNTMMAFEYAQGGLISANTMLSGPLKIKACLTIELIGLDKDPGNPRSDRRPADSDRRWLRRKEVWQLAERHKEKLACNNTPEVRELIVENALARGMFSIWWSVFAGDQDMRKRFREAFLGTASNCFNAAEDLVSRPGGQV